MALHKSNEMYRVLLMVTRNPTWFYWSKGGSSNAIWVSFIQVLLFLELRHKFEDLSNFFYHRSCFAHSRKGNIMFSCAKCWCWCFTKKNLKCLKLKCRLVAVETARQNLHFFFLAEKYFFTFQMRIHHHPDLRAKLINFGKHWV